MKLNPGESDSEITFKLSLVPVLGVEELESFHRVAKSRGRSVPEHLAVMIREELAEAAREAAA